MPHNSFRHRAHQNALDPRTTMRSDNDPTNISIVACDADEHFPRNALEQLARYRDFAQSASFAFPSCEFSFGLSQHVLANIARQMNVRLAHPQGPVLNMYEDQTCPQLRSKINRFHKRCL